MIDVFTSEEALAHAAAKVFVLQYRVATTQSGRFSVVLSGGLTPILTYQLLATSMFSCQIDWTKVHVFWGDERCVPQSDYRSNFRIAHDNFLSRVSIPPSHIHPMFNDQNPSQSAREYELVLTRYFDDCQPCFDLVFLGLGADGHTASLFPGSAAIEASSSWVAVVQNKQETFARITLSAELLNQTKVALFLVVGQEKASILREVLGPVDPNHMIPARLIQPAQGQLLWFVDASADPSQMSSKVPTQAADVPPLRVPEPSSHLQQKTIGKEPCNSE